VAVAVGWFSVTAIVGVAAGWTVAVLSVETKNAAVGSAVIKARSGRGVLVGRTIQAIGVGSTLS
jgi:hypothetical protein